MGLHVTKLYDVFGDVHGQYDKLVSLLQHLGYSESDRVWRHPERTAIFVGDLIDRGPKQLATVDLVRAMVEAGTAQCILGNHEFNAIAWATPDPNHPNRFLRPHSQRSNRKQHHAFLKEIEGTHRHAEIIAWFKTLPLWLDLEGLRVVHACWHQESMDLLRPMLGSNHTLTDEVILLGSCKDDSVFEAIEVVCKGPEVPLPYGITFQDKDGKVRDRVRVKWWLSDVTNYGMRRSYCPEMRRRFRVIHCRRSGKGIGIRARRCSSGTIGLPGSRRCAPSSLRVLITARPEMVRSWRIGGMGRPSCRPRSWRGCRSSRPRPQTHQPRGRWQLGLSCHH